MFNYDEDLAPPPKSRITTVQQLDQHDLATGDKLVLLDESLTVLYPWLKPLQPIIATITIEKALLGCRYDIAITDIVVVDSGQIKVPTERTTVSLDAIREALRQTEALRCDKPSSSHTSQREQKRTGLDYDAIATELKQQGQVTIPLPKRGDVNSFRTSIHTAMRKRGVQTNTEIKGGDAVFTVAKNPGK